jgi:hypothetical protein
MELKLLAELQTLVEGIKIDLKIDLNSGKKQGDLTLLKMFSSITEVDTDELELNSDGNLEGTLLLWLSNGKCIEIKGESFPKDLFHFDSLGDKKQQLLIDYVESLCTK